MASVAEVAVFVDSNLGTHLAMAVSPDASVGDFQRELEKTHRSCFPKLGAIEVYALMVKRKSCFYHLPSTMPMKYAFQHQDGSWFLHIEARTLKGSNGPCLSNFAAAEVGDHNCDGNHLINSLVQNIGQEAIISGGKELGVKALSTERDLSSMTKNLSSTGIVTGCLSNCQDRSLKHVSSPSTRGASQGLQEEELRTSVDNSSIQIEDSPTFMVRTPRKQSLSLSRADRTTGTPSNKFISCEVGKRIIIASNNIRVSANKQRPATPLSILRDGKLLRYNNISLAKFLVFEISDSED